MNPDWIEHRRGLDRELLGWMQPQGEGFVAIDLLGRPRTDATDWLTAEEALEDLGLSYLAEPYDLRTQSGNWIPVRIVEVSSARIRLKSEDWGDVTAKARFHEVDFADVLGVLRPREGAGHPFT